MKKKIFLLLTVFIFTMVSGSLFCQPAEEEEDPQALKLKAWKSLKRSRSLRAIKITKLRGNNFKVNMKDIKFALEKAGISEPVSISINVKGRELFNFGKFSPSIAGKSGGDEPKPKPKDIKFNMSSLNVKANFAMKKGGGDEPKPKPKDKIAARSSMAQNTRARLIFKNARGQVMARIDIGLRGLH